MSSKIIRKKYYNHIKENRSKERLISLKKAVISFSQLFGITHNMFIYSGEERIPFTDMHPEYQRILHQEFSDGIEKSSRERKFLKL